MSPKEVAPAARTSEEEPGLDFQSRLKLAEYFANGLSWFYLPDANAWPAMAERVPFLSSEKNRIERLREAFGEQVGWVVVEDQYIDRDYRDTFSHTFSKRFATPASRCQRIHFFAKEMGRSQKPDVNMKREELQESYLGYLVVRPTRPNGVGRTFLDPRIMKHEGFNLCLCGERITLFGKELQIEGFPFIGQDIDVTTCAQSTLWMIRRYYSNRYTQYSETHPNTLSKMAALRLREDRAFPATGLNDGQMAEMLRTMGYSPKVYCKDSFIHDEMRNNDRRIRTAKAQEEGREGKQIHFGEILLTYLESGIPLILSFKKGERYHSVACIGTAGVEVRSRIWKDPTGESASNRTEAEPLAYLTSTVIVADDNFAPYLRVNNELGELPATYPEAFLFREIDSIIVPLPHQINILAEEFDLRVREILNGKGTESKKLAIHERSPILKEALDSGNLALRCYLTSCRNFKQGLNEDQQMHDGIVAMAYRLMPMPHFIWVCELHDIRQEGELKCLGEVVWDSTCNRFEWQGLLALHYPELFVLNADSAFENRVTPDESRGWLEIQLQGRDRTAYSPGAANLIDI